MGRCRDTAGRGRRDRRRAGPRTAGTAGSSAPLLFFATTINYLDRQVLGILATPLQDEFRWSDSQYGWITTAFTGAYAAGQLVVGGLTDRLGTRVAFSLAVVCWSLAAMGHALARSAIGFGVARFALGLSESGNFPAAIKTVAEWYPKTERAFVTGIFNSGSNFGAIVAPLVVPWIATRFGWQWAFVVTGATGFAWLAAWLAIYRKPEEHPAPLPGGAGLHPKRPHRADGRDPLGDACSATARRGRSRPASSLPIRSGGSSCSGCRSSSNRSTASP